jgi:acyl dehydratase
MGMTLTKDTIEESIGKEVGVSEWVEMTQESVNTFADITRDHQFIHIDQEKAAQTPFGGTIVHGFFTVSMLSHFSETGCGIAFEGAKMGLNYGSDKLRFLNPVRVGSRIRGRAKLLSVIEKNPGQFLVKTEMVVEIENVEKPALITEWLTMIIT